MRETTKQFAFTIIDTINEYYEKYNSLPSIQEIATILDKPKSTISDYVRKMANANMLEFDSISNKYKTIKISKLNNHISRVAVVGEIACGSPLLAEENITDYISISDSVLGSGKFFALKAKGNSMINAGINDGDIVIIRQQQNALEGQIVVALIDNEATLKRFYIDKDKKQIRLHPENDTMQDMYFDNIEIQGVVKKVLKDVF